MKEEVTSMWSLDDAPTNWFLDDSAETPPEPSTYKKTTYRGIARVDNPERGLVGYWARVTWKGQNYAKFFNDRKSGDAFGALTDAIEWRDKTETEIGKRDQRGKLRTPARRKSNTGVAGITEVTRAGKPAFQVTWIHGEKVHRTSVSISKYGRAEAMRRAKDIYKNMKKSVVNTSKNPS